MPATIPVTPRAQPALTSPVDVGRAIRVGLITNPASGRNARGGNMARLRNLVDVHAGVRHHEAIAPAEIEAAVQALLAVDTELIVVSGGDGTVQAVLTALMHAPARSTLPVLAVLPGGTTNMTAGALGIVGRQSRTLQRLLAGAANGRLEGKIVSCPILGVDFQPQERTLYGLFFGGGAIYHLIRFYHRRIEALGMRNEAGPGLTFAFFLAKIVLGHKGALLPPVQIGGTADGHPISAGPHLGLLATTLDRLFFGIRPFWGDQPGSIRYSALGYSPRGIALSILPILRGRPGARVTPERGYFSRRASEIELSMDSGFALDGELFDPTPGTRVTLRDDRRAFFLVPDRS